MKFIYIVTLISVFISTGKSAEIEANSNNALIIWQPKSAYQIMEEACRNRLTEWNAKISRNISDDSNPDFNVRTKKYAEKMQIDQAFTLDISNKEKEYLEKIVWCSNELCGLLNGQEYSQNDKIITSLRHQIYENAYDFIYYSVCVVKDSFMGYSSEHEESFKHHQLLISNFLNSPEISECIKIITKCCPILPEIRPTLSDLVEGSIIPPTMEHPLEIGKSIFMPSVLKIVNNIAIFPEESSELEAHCEKILTPVKYTEKLMYYGEKIVPLSRIYLRIININRPGLITPLSDKEFNYLKKEISLLSFLIRENISYENMEPSNLESHQKNLNCKDLDKKQKAIEKLLYNKIPWAALQNLGVILYDGKREPSNLSILRDALPELIEEFVGLQSSFEALLNFKVSTYESPPASPSEYDFTRVPLKNMNLINEYIIDFKNLLKAKEYIDNIISHYSTINPTKRHQYALIRVLEVIGEVSKNISLCLKSQNTMWKTVADIRDIFAHLERPSVQARLKEILDFTDQTLLNSIVLIDLKNLQKYIDEQTVYIKSLNNWKDINDFYVHLQSSASADETLSDTSETLPHISTLLKRLEDRLTFTERQSLETSFTSRDRSRGEAKERLKRILVTKEEASDLSPDLIIIETLSEKLSLSKTIQKNLREYREKFFTNVEGDKFERVVRSINGIIILDDSQARLKFDELINRMNDKLPWVKVLETLQEIGISDKDPWKKLYDTINTPAIPSASEKKISLDDRYIKTLKMIRFAAQNILYELEILDIVTDGVRDINKEKTLGNFSNDNILYYACEHSLASFRKHANNLLNTLDYLKPYSETSFDALARYQLCAWLKSDLRNNVFQGNSAMHLHDLTEPSSLTNFGYRFVKFQELISALDGIPIAGGTKRMISTSERLKLCLQETARLLDDRSERSQQAIITSIPLYTTRKERVTIPPSKIISKPDGTRSMIFTLFPGRGQTLTRGSPRIVFPDTHMNSIPGSSNVREVSKIVSCNQLREAIGYEFYRYVQTGNSKAKIRARKEISRNMRLNGASRYEIHAFKVAKLRQDVIKKRNSVNIEIPKSILKIGYKNRNDVPHVLAGNTFISKPTPTSFPTSLTHIHLKRSIPRAATMLFQNRGDNLAASEDRIQVIQMIKAAFKEETLHLSIEDMTSLSLHATFKATHAALDEAVRTLNDALGLVDPNRKNADDLLVYMQGLPSSDDITTKIASLMVELNAVKANDHGIEKYCMNSNIHELFLKHYFAGAREHSHEDTTRRSRDYVWNLSEDNSIHFQEGNVIGDGNCAFTALGTTRTDAINLILNNTNEQWVRTLLRPDILARITDPADTHTLPLILQNLRIKFRDRYNELLNRIEEVRAQVNQSFHLEGEGGLARNQVADFINNIEEANKFRQDLIELNIIDSEIETFNPTQEVVNAFLQDEFIDRNEYLTYHRGGGGTLEALARLKRIGVTILTGENSLDQTLNVDPPLGVYEHYYLHHTGFKNDEDRMILNHFNLLYRES